MSLLPGDIVQQMLAAARNAAGARWGTISNDLENWAKQLSDEAESVAADLKSGAIDEDEAKIELDGIANTAAMIGDYADEALKISAQNAINSAIGVLWNAISAIPK